MPYRDPAKQKEALATWAAEQGTAYRKKRAAQKALWYQRRKKGLADPTKTIPVEDKRNKQTALLKKAIPVVTLEGQGAKGHSITPTLFADMTPKEVHQCFRRDADGVLHLRTVSEQLDILRAYREAKSQAGKRPYSVIQNKVFFNKDAILTVDELVLLATKLKERVKRRGF